MCIIVKKKRLGKIPKKDKKNVNDGLRHFVDVNINKLDGLIEWFRW